ncbi:MAG TPA: response regulator [Candidatus Dormibacteraeota bacterium]|nr:response regulator [Candidatus Dormibacteraeota bacterium]
MTSKVMLSKRKTRKTTKPARKKRSRSPRKKEIYRPQATESKEIVLAIRRGQIDALVMAGKNGDEVITLQGAEHPYRVLVETINDGVATLDTNGVILYANSRFAAIFRVRVQKLIGLSLQSELSVANREILRKLISEGLSNSTSGEITLQIDGGRARIIRLSLNPIKNSNPRAISMVATEMTELVEANEALRSNEESLRQLSSRLLQLQDEERRRISRDLHDITGQKLAFQTIGLSHVLNRKPDILDEESRQILLDCSNLSKQVSEEIRTLSYLLHPPLLDELGLSSAVRWYTEGYERRTGIEVKVDIPPDFVRLPADTEVTLFRVIQESLTNIHRYSGSSKAYVRLKENANNIEAQIGDFGKGMHPEMVNLPSGKMVRLGVGIQGMKERMRQLGGKLEIASQPKHGTVVTATLPVSHPEAAVLPDAVAGTAAPLPMSRRAEPAQSNRSASRKQILIADDHEMLRRGLRTMMEKENSWQICGEAVDGQDAVEKAKALRPDLVILDINMPVLNGLQAAKFILSEQPHIKILIFTVHDSEQTLKEIKAVGAHGYLSKSNASDDLVRVVKEILETNSSSTFAHLN